MRLTLGLCALATIGGAAHAQVSSGLHAGISPASSPSNELRAPRQQPGDSLHLSRRQAIADALTRNPQIDVARQHVAEARARRVTDIAIPDPTFSAGFDQIGGPFSFGGAPSRPIALGLDVPWFDKFRLNNRIGLADIGANQQDYRLQVQTTTQQTSSTYDSLLVAYRQRQVLQEALTLASDFLKRTQLRYNEGSVAKLDVIQAQVGVAQAQNDLIGNEGAIAAAQASMNRMLGRLAGAPIAPTDSLTMPPPLPDSSSIEQIALANRPEVASVVQQQLGARATTSLTKEFWLPDLQFSVQKDYAVPGQPALFTTGIALPLPAFYWQHSKGDIAQAQHFETELAATNRDTRNAVVQDVRTSYANASTAMKQAAFLQDQLVPSAREAYRVASTSYSLGGSSALEVITARQTLLQAEEQLATALAAANTARTDLNRALGLNPTPGAPLP